MSVCLTFPNCKGEKQCAITDFTQVMGLNLRLGTSAVLRAERTLCLDDSGMCISAFPTSFYHKYCGDEVLVHRVMWEFPLTFLGTFCHSEENLKSYFAVWDIKLVCLKNLKNWNFWGRGEGWSWPLTCDFWALKGAAALLPPTHMDADCCRGDFPQTVHMAPYGS